MKFTLDWLKDYLQTDASAADIAAALTNIGLEIEDVIEPIAPVAAKIIECEYIPGTHLHLLKADDGEQIRQIVCGAPNVRAGMTSALARPGAVIAGNEIKVGKIRGHESNGMMCSEKELGISGNHEGIIELDAAEYPVGRPLSIADCQSSAVFDASILPNHPEYLAVRGIARDLAAAGIGTMRRVAAPGHDGARCAAGNRKSIIENSMRCPAYGFAEIRGITIAPSDPKIAERLAAIGINPKNAAVDATNYVCHDIGQPLHCFDADDVRGDIIIRNAEAGESFTDLFDARHVLAADDLVITDSDGILALAGVVGGKRGMTTDRTKNIILEAAYFEPLGIRKTRRRLNISTDASYRYERGVDPAIAGEGLARAIDLIQAECGGEVVSVSNSRFAVCNSVVEYSPSLFKKKTGIDLGAEKQLEILKKLGYEADASDVEHWALGIPSWRTTEIIPETLIADMLRIHGYNNIAVAKAPKQNIPPSLRAAREAPVAAISDGDAESAIKSFLSRDCRLMEHISMGFGNAYSEKLVSSRPNIMINNPMTDAMNTARNSLIPNMLDAVAGNARRGYSDLALFEYGTVFDGPNPGEQHDQILIARTGMASPRHWLRRARPVDIFDAKADLLSIFNSRLLTDASDPPAWAHPYKYGRLVADGRIVGEFGELHPKLARHWKIKAPVMLALIDMERPEDKHDIFVANIRPAAGRYAPRQSDRACEMLPPLARDFSFSLEKEIAADAVLNAAISADPMIADALEFDFYENSIAFSITILPDRNLTDADLLAIQNKVIAAVEPLGARIRDK